MSPPVPRLIEALALSTILLERLEELDQQLLPPNLVELLDQTCERLHDELGRQAGTFAVSTS